MSSAINLIFIAFLVTAILVGGYSDRLESVSEASFQSAKTAVTLAIDLIGTMALWLGLVRVLEAGGLMYTIALALKPLMLRLFPDVPPQHPAMGAMILNFAANLLGLGNAATPMGIKAMLELNKLNPFPGRATNAMCLFLAINTSSITIFPLTVIGMRAAANSSSPAAIWLPTLLATITSTVVAILVCLAFTRNEPIVTPNSEDLDEENGLIEVDKGSREQGAGSREQGAGSREQEEEGRSYEHLLYHPPRWARVSAWLFVIAFLGAMISGLLRHDWSSGEDILSHWLIPGLILLIVAYGFGRGVKVYEAVTEGAKQGFDISIRIIPFLVAILVAIGMFRASGAMNMLTSALSPYTSWIGMPPETIPMALIRPLSGSGALGVMSDLLQQGPDSYEAFVASTMMGSTETTFYVLAIYFGSVSVTKMRHTVLAGISADIAGLVSASIWSSVFFRP